MATTNLDYLTRLQNVLIEAKQEYNVLQYISLDGIISFTAASAKRTVTIPISTTDAVAVFTELTDAAYARIKALEKELAQAIEEFGDEIGVDHPLIATARALANGESIPEQSTAPTSSAAA